MKNLETPSTKVKSLLNVSVLLARGFRQNIDSLSNKGTHAFIPHIRCLEMWLITIVGFAFYAQWLSENCQ